MKKIRKDDYEYELTIPYENDEDLGDTIYDMFDEIQSMAELRYCFTESDVRDIDSERSW